MDIEYISALKTLADHLPDNFDWQGLISDVSDRIPVQLDFLPSLEFSALFFVGILIMGLLGRVAMGKRSGLNHAVSSAMGILFIYALTVIIYTLKPHTLTDLITPLPFISLAGDCLVFLPVRGMALTFTCTQILSLVVLAFLVNLLDTFIPKGDNIIIWYFLRFLTVALAMGIHYGVYWACNAYLPVTIMTYAPAICLGILLLTLLMGVLNMVLGVALTMVNPIFGAVYAFFFSNIIGKQLTKAVLTTALIIGVFYLLETLGYAIIVLSLAALTACIPLGLVLLVLWYLLGHVL